MSGRGDNNKKGSSGRGGANQSNQAIGDEAKQGKSYHGDETGGKPSQPQQKSKDQSANRNQSLDKEEP